MTAPRRSLLLVVLASGLAAVTAFGYLGGFLAPDDDANGLPLAVVNLDRGTTIGSTSVRYGDQVQEQLRAPNPVLGDTVTWVVVADRDEAAARVRADAAYAALIIPEDFSSRLVAIATTGTTDPAAIEVLTNPASGSYSGAYSQAVALAAVDQVSRDAARQLAANLDALGVKVSPTTAMTLGRPVEPRLTVAHPIGPRGGRGLAPFYFAVVVVVAALFATSAMNAVIDVAAGRQRIVVLGRSLRFGSITARGPLALLRAKLALTVPIAVTVGLTVTAVALGPLRMTVKQPVLLAVFATLGATATAALTVALYTAFDLAGSILAALVLVIYGVPASAGVYPVQALPSFFRFLHAWLPLRYVSDGVRALSFGGGPAGSAGRAAAVLGAYALAGTLAAFAAASRARTRPARHVRMSDLTSALPAGADPAWRES